MEVSSSSSRRSAQVVRAMLLFMAASLLVVGVREGEAAITCSTVSGDLAPCLTYLTSSASAPSGACCSGVQRLYAATQSSRPDRITTCGCIKTLAQSIGSKLNSASVSNLPGKCQVNLGYSISVNTNCQGIP